MAYGFNPASLFMLEEPALPQFLTPEEIQQQAITERFNAGRSGGFVPAMMGALDYMRTAMPAQAPTPRTVSGGSARICLGVNCPPAFKYWMSACSAAGLVLMA